MESPAQFVHIQFADGIHHMSRDLLYFKQLQACNGREYTDALELIDDYRKYLRLMEHFDTFEKEERQDINGTYPTFPLLARIKFPSETALQFDGKSIPYRVLSVAKDPHKWGFLLANHINLYWQSELEFYIKTPDGLIKLY